MWPGLHALERLALRVTSGLGLTALLLSLGALWGVFAYAVGLVIAIAAAGTLLGILCGRRPGAAKTARTDVGLAVVIVASVVACIGAIAPITDDDALAYVVPVANRIAATGALRVWSDQARAMWPQSQQVLLAAVGWFGGDRLGVVTALEWLLCIGVIAALARRVCERPEHVWPAIVIACGAPVFAFQVASGKEDLLLIAATAATAFCLAGDDPRELALGGLFAGIAAGAKYTGGIVAGAAVIWMVLRQPKSPQRALVVAAAACVTGALWYIVNFWRYGNAVAPFLFGAPGTVLDSATARAFVDGYGARSALGFLVAPVHIFIEPSIFGGRGNLYNPLVYAGLLTIGVASARIRHRAPLFLAAVFYVGWFMSLHNARLLLPAAVLLAPAAADVLVPFAKRYTSLAVASGLLAALACALPPAIGVVRAVRYIAGPSTFLELETQNYADIQWMNAHLDPRRDRVASDHKVLAYLGVPWIFLAPTYQLEFSQRELDDPERLLQALRRQRITHLFGSAGSFPGLLPHLRVVYSNPASRLGGVRFFREPPAEATAVFVLQ